MEKRMKVHIDYHVSFDEHHYSVPYTLIHQELEVRATAKTIEVYRKGVRMCSHRRDYQKHGYTTVKEAYAAFRSKVSGVDTAENS